MRVMELTEQELLFAKLRAQGLTKADAYEQAFPEETASKTRKAVVEAAGRVSRRGHVAAMVKDLFREARKSAIMSHCEYLDMLRDDYITAKKAKNWTAAASYARLIGQCIGALSETINLQDQRLSDEQLIDRLAGQDPKLAEILRSHLSSKQEFDA